MSELTEQQIAEEQRKVYDAVRWIRSRPSLHDVSSAIVLLVMMANGGSATEVEIEEEYDKLSNAFHRVFSMLATLEAKKQSMENEMKVDIDGATYEWVGGIGCVVRSRERGVKSGDVRFIHRGLFYARIGDNANKWNPEVSWISVYKDDQNFDYIRKFKKSLFGCED